MKKTIKLTIELDLVELSDKERKECADLEECEPDELPSLADASIDDIGECVQMAVTNYEEMFSGSGLYLKIAAARVRGGK